MTAVSSRCAHRSAARVSSTRRDTRSLSALHSLGFAQVRDVRVGRHVVVDADAEAPEARGHAVRAMCERLLANPVIEDFEIASIGRP